MKLISEHAESLRGCLNFIKRSNSAAMCKVKPTIEEVWVNLELERKKKPLNIKMYCYSKESYEYFNKILREEMIKEYDNIKKYDNRKF